MGDAKTPFFGRAWNYAQGNELVRAEFIQVEDQEVELRKADDDIVRFPLAKFSQADQDYANKGILIHEDFSTYEEGDVTEWGRNAYVSSDNDKRIWLVTAKKGGGSQTQTQSPWARR